LTEPAAPELRLGMIGCGQISNRFFNWAEKAPGVRFVATCAAHEESARAKAEERGCERWFTDYHKLLASPDLDAVVITTPHQMHAPMATDAVRAGKHVLVEKPMTSRWTHAQELAAAVKQSGVTFMALPYVHYPVFNAALRYVREEYIGKITAVEADFNLPGPPRSNWYYSKEAEGGAMLDTMPYALARVAALMGPAVKVTAQIGQLLPLRLTGDGGRVKSEVDDDATIVLQYGTGQQGVVRSSWAQSYMRNSTVVHGRHGDVFLGWWPSVRGYTGSHPLVVKSDRAPVPDAQPIEFMGLPNCYAPGVPDLAVEPNMISDFAECIRTGATPKCGIDIGLHIAEQGMMAFESSRTGRAIDLTTTFDLWWDREPDIMRLDQDYL
jgi:predicted dehydrogenase